MSKVIQVKFAPATTTKPKRCVAYMDSIVQETEWNYNLSDIANFRLAANQALLEHNFIDYANKLTIVTGAFMPKPNDGYVYIAE